MLQKLIFINQYVTKVLFLISTTFSVSPLVISSYFYHFNFLLL